ncbi:MAG: hypothetical protein HRT90_10905 [Candidatus Margulisbacteria bacterium]|nr:hypothetical protein [Candidatus Margulisiibacteriota bacterium]
MNKKIVSSNNPSEAMLFFNHCKRALAAGNLVYEDTPSQALIDLVKDIYGPTYTGNPTDDFEAVGFIDTTGKWSMTVDTFQVFCNAFPNILPEPIQRIRTYYESYKTGFMSRHTQF